MRSRPFSLYLTTSPTFWKYHGKPEREIKAEGRQRLEGIIGMEGLAVSGSAQGTGKDQCLTPRSHVRRAEDGGAGLGATVQGRVADYRVYPRNRGVPNTAKPRPKAESQKLLVNTKCRLEARSVSFTNPREGLSRIEAMERAEKG